MKRTLLLLPCLLAPLAAQAQDDEADRLRDALRHTTVDLRAAEDSIATLQASLDEANKQKAQLQQQLDAANAKLNAQPAAPAAPPPPSQADQAKFRVALAQLQSQNAALREGLNKWQGAYQQAASIAREKDQESRTLGGTSKAEGAQLKTCQAENAKLVSVAQDILHLYRTQSFHQILVWSYEPLLGLDQVKLENIEQDYEDRIRNQAYIPGQTDAAPTRP